MSTLGTADLRAVDPVQLLLESGKRLSASLSFGILPPGNTICFRLTNAQALAVLSSSSSAHRSLRVHNALAAFPFRLRNSTLGFILARLAASAGSL